MAALASLTEMYTDSEGEEGRSERRGSISDDFDEEQPTSRRRSTSVSKINKLEVKKDVSGSRSSTLVSYFNDTVISDEEGEKDVVTHPEPMEMTSDHESSPAPVEPPPPPPPVEKPNDTSSSAVDLPPEPTGKCSNEMQQKIATLAEKMKVKGHDMNAIIQERKSFRNPSIYEKLIQFCDINEFGTNYSPQIYDPHKWNKGSYYDELAKVQKAEMYKREKERKTSKVEVIMGTAKKANGAPAEEDRKRKSKWDQVGLPGVAGVRPPSAAGLITLTSSSTGTKSTVISAFGSLPKKPKV